MNAIKVHSIAQERWYIQRQQCQCGGRLTKELEQALIDGPRDRIIVACERCEKVATFHFDISSCAPHLNFGDLAKKYEAYTKVMTAEEASYCLAPKMDQVLDFMRECKTVGDVIALEFIADAVAQAKQGLPAQK